MPELRVSATAVSRPPVAAGLAVLCAFAGTAIALAPALLDAAPVHNHGLTIAATPDPIFTGEAVLVYGQLNHGSPASTGSRSRSGASWASAIYPPSDSFARSTPAAKPTPPATCRTSSRKEGTSCRL